MNVVMVHGFWDTGRLFDHLGRRLAAAGHRCYAPTLRPRDGRAGLPDLAQKLAVFIQHHGACEQPTALIGFSMGALVARYYLQELGGAASMRAFFSIAGPHAGTWSAWGYPGVGSRQMRPNSAFLRTLAASEHVLQRLPVFAYWTPLDLMILPARSCRLRYAQERTVWSPLHALLPYDPRLGASIVADLAMLEQNVSAR